MTTFLNATTIWRNVSVKFLLVGLFFVPRTQAEELLLEVVDELGQPLPARVRVRDEAGNDHFPDGSLKIPLGKDEWFVTPGKSQLEVPIGKLDLRVEHGLEYRPEKHSVRCHAGQTIRHRVRLARWIKMRDQGYLCGENHLHVPLDQLGPQLVAEGLDFGTSLQWWNARRFDVSPTGGEVRLLEFAGVKVPTSVYDYEIEHDWGAVYVLGQPTPLLLGNEPDQPNLPIIRRSRESGALVCYQGGWSREVLLDALLGQVDVVNICNNNFLRHAYQPRSQYSNLLSVPGFPTYADNAEEMLRMNTETYYRLLNCGVRLAAGAGSATGPKRSPVGYNRAYVRVGQNATLQEFLEGWRQGKNFVTNGPMLFLKVNDRYRPGDVVKVTAGPESLSIEVVAFSLHPISSLEIVLNGRIVHRAVDPKSGIETRVPIIIKESSWLAVRCTVEDQLLSDDELSAYAWGADRMLRKPSRLRFAHTSPIYFSLGGENARVDQSVNEAYRMLDALIDFAKERLSGATRQEILSSLGEARKRLDEH